MNQTNLKKKPKPHTKQKTWNMLSEVFRIQENEPWWIFLLWCFVLLIPTFDFLTYSSPQEG